MRPFSAQKSRARFFADVDDVCDVAEVVDVGNVKDVGNVL